MNERTEIGWQKSSYSACDGNCVEAARLANEVLLRDSKAPDQILEFSIPAWREFLSTVRARKISWPAQNF
jgi:Domain of unknown function (DUF397)